MKMILKSLISNDATITGARKHKWWVALLILLFSVLISTLPVFTQTISKQGDALFSSSAYGLDMASVSFLDECEMNGYELKIVDHKFQASGWSKGTSIDFIPVGESEVDAKFYWADQDFGDTSINLLYNNQPYTVMIFFEEDVLLHLVNPNTTKKATEMYFEKAYKDIDDCNLVDALLSKTDSTINFEDSWNNIKGFYKKAYNYQRVVGAFTQAGLIAAVDASVIFLMGLMVFILTRGKTNPFKVVTFWESQKVAWWASTSPAILGVLFGFLFTNFASMSFVLFYGVRVMWLTMKQFRPDGTGYVLPKEPVKTVNVK